MSQTFSAIAGTLAVAVLVFIVAYSYRQNQKNKKSHHLRMQRYGLEDPEGNPVDNPPDQRAIRHQLIRDATGSSPRHSTEEEWRRQQQEQYERYEQQYRQQREEEDIYLPAYTEEVSPNQDAGYYKADGTFVTSAEVTKKMGKKDTNPPKYAAGTGSIRSSQGSSHA